MTNEFFGNLLVVIPEQGVQGGQRHVLQRQLFLRTAGGRGSREVREGEGWEGEQGRREKGALALSALQLGSVSSICPDASEEVQAGGCCQYTLP